MPGLDLLLELADDELILGWRNSEWTGIAPFLEEDVAFSSIAQNEIGHARALYELVAASSAPTPTRSRSTGRSSEYRCAPLVELRRLEWARTIARHWLYETADAVRLEALQASDDAELAGHRREDGREEVYHRIHAEMWLDRLLASDGRPQARLEGRSTSSGRTRSACSTRGCAPELRRRSRRGSAGRCPTSSRSSAAATRRSSRSCSTR